MNAVAVTNIEAVEKFIWARLRVTTQEIQESLRIGMAVTMSILYNRLRVRKRCAEWIPHSLTDEELRVRVGWCKFMLRKFNESCSKLTWEVLTGDKTWICQYNPNTKMLSAVWLFLDQSPPPKLKGPCSAQKKTGACFFGKFCRVATIPLEDRWTVNAD